MKAGKFLYIGIILISILSVLFSLTLRAQTNFEYNDSSVTVFVHDGVLKVQVCSDKIIRITHSPSKAIIPDTSLSVNAVWGKVHFDVKKKNNEIGILTKFLQVQINEKSGSVNINDSTGESLFSEDTTLPASFIPEEVLGEKTHNAQLNFHLTRQEGVYGMGQFQKGIMDYRGQDLELIQKNTQVAVPFLLSTKKYGLLFDNYSKIKFHDEKNKTSVWFEVADNINYYVIAGTTMDDVISGYRKTTGRAPMLGRWAYGYWQSKERYMTQDEILNVAEEFRNNNIPVDNIIQDWQYWGDNWEYWNAMKFDSLRYFDPKGMIDDLHNKYHIHLMVSIWPVIGQKTSLFAKLERKGLLFSPYHWTDGHTYDAYSLIARHIYWNALNHGLFSLGVDAFWMDATEPEIVLAPTERSTKEARRNVLGTMARYLNPYSLLTTGAVYKGQRAATSEKRVFILTRSAFSGQQRYAAATWSGDIVADWHVFRNQISAGLNFCMSGIPYWSNDIGGFHIYRYGGFPGGNNNPGYRELYVRWFEYGVFNPIFRSHGTDAPREPWQFGKPGTWAYDAILKFDRLRYRLIPYIYSLAWEVTNKGYTMMRGLPMDFPADTNVYHINDQYMFGPAFLVNPVTKHMYYGESYNNTVIPSEYLRTPDGKPGGYSAQYFNGTNFDTLMVDSVQTELLFDLYLGKDLPPVVNWEHNSIRWSGSFRSRSAGEYELWLSSDDAVRFFLDGKLIVDGWNNKGKDSTYRILVSLEKEHWYSFKIEYARLSNATKLRLAWRTPEMITPHFDPAHENGLRSIYLPPTINGWCDFWTGQQYSGNQKINREVPIDLIPLYVKAGSVIPMGPEEQYASEKSAGPIEFRIYSGADGSFNLYNDEGDNYKYENGLYSIIPLQWNEKSQTLTIGKCIGTYPGMPEQLTFKIVWVGDGHGTGVNEEENPDVVVKYNGQKINIKKK